VGLFAAGWRLGSRRLGVALAFAWAANPFTLYSLNMNSNDALVGALLAWTFALLAIPAARGAMLAAAALTKFAPLALVPLWASFSRRRLRDAIAFSLAFGAVMVLVFAFVVPDGGVRELYDRTIGFQLGRDSPFSLWGQEEGLGWLQDVVKAGTVLLAAGVALVPRNKTALQVAALGAAVLIAVQLGLSHWFYLYIVWWLPLALIALLSVPSRARPEPLSARTT
jgi:hypothetical protein